MITILVILVVALILGLYQKNTNAICKSRKRLDGRTVIVTGGTLGMGLKIATDLADRGARVIVACPFVDEGTRGRDFIVGKTGNENVIFKILDLSSLKSIRDFVSEINRSEERLDILINNAGVGTVKNRLTKDGMSFIMEVNYFGQFLLTLLLIPLMHKSGTKDEPARIINTSSVMHILGVVNFDKLNSVTHYYPIQVYSNSKLCVMLFTCELSKRLRGTNIVCNCVNPGAVGTGIFFTCTNKMFASIISFLFSSLFKTPWEGAQTALHVALDKIAGVTNGEYFENCRVSRAKKVAYSDDIGGQLWQESVRLTRIMADEIDACAFKY
ncbi:retinol dehydrogenase 11-like [Aricia agestis]|uniref:retinol dehydrogenase 11-like n=1 Tax=Aricia agestis TaxID=91739 RepID=UPI001C204908|nr:retinol dehydrogenase 11-like [Aricia agestis]